MMNKHMGCFLTVDDTQASGLLMKPVMTPLAR